MLEPGVSGDTGGQDTAVLCTGDNVERFKLDKNGKVKFPRRLIHCSDGIVEEYSSDEEEEEEELPPPVDTSKLTWGPYFWYYTVKTAVGGLAVCDYLGEKLAYFFGITSPKYQYAISEWERMREEEKEEEELEREERAAEDAMVRAARRSGNSEVLEMGDIKTEVQETDFQYSNSIVTTEAN